MFALSELLQAFGKELPAGARDAMFSEATQDSRQVIPGGLFVAIRGERVDGHAFLAQAFAAGAIAALVEEDCSAIAPQLDLRPNAPLFIGADDGAFPSPPYRLRVERTIPALQRIAAFHRAQLPMKVIGITGTVGKSTTKELTAQVLSQHYATLKNIGNLNNEIGLPLTLLRAERAHERAVLEMGFYVPGEIDLLCEIAKPTIGVITNIGAVHAERAGSLEIIARGKGELIRALPSDGIAILNADDPLVLPMARETRARVLTYGLTPNADIWADQIESFGLKGIAFRLHYAGEVYALRLPLIGRHSALTALRAAAVCFAENMPWHEIERGLTLAHAQIRLSVLHLESGAIVIDDTYNASPESTIAALDLLSEMDGRRIAILGDMLELGQYEKQGHEQVGRRAASACHELICVGERTRVTIQAALAAGMKETDVRWFPALPELMDFTRERPFAQGEVALIKGSRSLQMERIVNALEVRP